MQSFRTRYGPWAIVTGASSGIGAEFAAQLAKAGMNLVLVARRLERLEALKAELAVHGVDILCVAVDLAEEGCLVPLARVCEPLDIGLVVHNAGTGCPGPFAAGDVQREKEIIRLNCVTPMEMARHFLPPMQAKGRGGMIFVSSLMGFQGVPYMANYSATKGYLLNLGESLHHECKGDGVDVLVLAPGATETPGKYLHDVDYAQLPVAWMPAQAVVASALKHLGRRAFVIPGWRNHFTACLSGGLWSRGWVQRVMARVGRAVLRVG